MTAIRSLLFNIAFFGWTFLCCLVLVWLLLAPRRTMMAVVHWYLGTVSFLERTLIGLDYRVVGREHLPDGPCIVAAKHQSAWETMKLHLLLDEPAVVLKRELMRIPVWGWFAGRAGMIPVDRGAGSTAVTSMVAKAREALVAGQPIVIFPQGTRVAPGAYRSYKVGTFALYDALGVPVVPMALNSGLLWGRQRFLKLPGTVTVEFLPPIAPGLDRQAFMKRLEDQLESAVARLSDQSPARGPNATEPPEVRDIAS